MNAYDYHAIAADGATWCLEHITYDPSNPEHTPVFANSEWDSYPCCHICGKVFDYVSLTDHGQRYETLHAYLHEYECNRCDIAQAVYWHANDFHDGHGSRLYEALCTISRVYKPGHSEHCVEEYSTASDIYNAISTAECLLLAQAIVEGM